MSFEFLKTSQRMKSSGEEASSPSESSPNLPGIPLSNMRGPSRKSISPIAVPIGEDANPSSEPTPTSSSSTSLPQAGNTSSHTSLPSPATADEDKGSPPEPTVARSPQPSVGDAPDLAVVSPPVPIGTEGLESTPQLPEEEVHVSAPQLPEEEVLDSVAAAASLKEALQNFEALPSKPKEALWIFRAQPKEVVRVGSFAHVLLAVQYNSPPPEFTDENHHHFKALVQLLTSAGICEEMHNWEHVKKNSKYKASGLLHTYLLDPLRKWKIDVNHFQREASLFFKERPQPGFNQTFEQRHGRLAKKGMFESLANQLSCDLGLAGRVVPEASRRELRAKMKETGRLYFNGPLLELTKYAVENIEYVGENATLPIELAKDASENIEDAGENESLRSRLNRRHSVPSLSMEEYTKITRLEDWARRPEVGSAHPNI